MTARGMGGAACVDPRLAGGTGWDGGSLDETQPDRTRPISTIAGTRIEFLHSVSIGLHAKDSGADPDLKQKMICSHFDVDACRLPGIEIVPPAFEGTLDRVRRILGSRQAVAIRQGGHAQACCRHDPAGCFRGAVA